MLYIGTSGWSYADRQSTFYPPDLKGAARLPFYAERYDTAEVNVTFYRFPTDAMLNAWNRGLPPRFALSVKGSRRITHTKALPQASTVQYFFARTGALRTLRVMLWQLPPHRAFSADYLRDFIALVREPAPASLRQAIECRHASWWNDTTYAVLEQAGFAFVNISHPTLPDEFVTTSDFHYVRFHGLNHAHKYHYLYTRRELQPWARRLQAVHGDAFVYFNNCYDGNALRNAVELRELSTAVNVTAATPSTHHTSRTPAAAGAGGGSRRVRRV